MSENTGIIFDFAGAESPAGSMVCNGQEITQADYPDLYAAIGDLWANTDGITPPAAGNFRVPPQEHSGVPSFLCGVAGAAVVGDFLASQNMAHTHAATITGVGNHTHTIVVTHATNINPAIPSVAAGTGQNFTTSSAGAHEHTVTLAEEVVGLTALPQHVVFLRCIWI